MSRANKKIKKKRYEPSPLRKGPRKNIDSEKFLEISPAWHTGLIDLKGPCDSCNWENIGKEKFLKDILIKIREFENKSWNEILIVEQRKNHEIEISKFPIEAIKRLERLGHSDIEKLVSLRLTGKNRIYGIRHGHILKILWWDSDHKIYPVSLRHT